MTEQEHRLILERLCRQRADFFLDKIARIVGHEVRLLRDDLSTACRAIVAYELTEEGYSKSQIGRSLNVSRALVQNYRRRVESILLNPRFYEEAFNVYVQFKERRNDVYYRSNQGAVKMGGLIPDSNQFGLCQRCESEERREDLRDPKGSDRNKHAVSA